ncbi:hypothetical protein ACFY0A_43925 [Streptomyces sp. NPDC001698]
MEAHYAFAVKKNQPGLYAQLKALPWDKARAKFYDRYRPDGAPLTFEESP